jgi:hypothetical protein
MAKPEAPQRESSGDRSTVTFELPEDVADALRARLGDVAKAARQALLVAAFRGGEISHHELARGLGLDRFETDTLLQRLGVTEHTLSSDEVDADRATLDRLLGPVER